MTVGDALSPIDLIPDVILDLGYCLLSYGSERVKWGIMITDYKMLSRQLRVLIHGVPHKIANLSNAAALRCHTLDDLNWEGFYLMENGVLVLGPFQGKAACIEIQVGLEEFVGVLEKEDCLA